MVYKLLLKGNLNTCWFLHPVGRLISGTTIYAFMGVLLISLSVFRILNKMPFSFDGYYSKGGLELSVCAMETQL